MWIFVCIVALSLIAPIRSNWEATIANEVQLSSNTRRNPGSFFVLFRKWGLIDKDADEMPAYCKYLRSQPPRSLVIAHFDHGACNWTAALTNQFVVSLKTAANPKIDNLAERKKDVEDIFSPYVPISRTVELIEKHEADCFPVKKFSQGGEAGEATLSRVREKFLSNPQLFPVLYEDKYVYVFGYTPPARIQAMQNKAN